MSAAQASWQKQLVYEFKELEGLQDAALLADSQGRLQQACSRLVAQLAAAAGAPQQQQQLLVLLRLIPLPALVNRVLCCANSAPPELSAIDDDLIRCVCLCAAHQDILTSTLTPCRKLPTQQGSVLTNSLHVPCLPLTSLQHKMMDRQSLHPQQQHLLCAGSIDSPATCRSPLQRR